MSTVSRISCFSAGVMSMKLAIRSAELRRRGDALDAGDQLGRGLRQQLQHLHRLGLQVEEAGLDLGAVRLGLRNALDARHEERIAVEELDDVEAPLALADHVMRAVRAVT